MAHSDKFHEIHRQWMARAVSWRGNKAGFKPTQKPGLPCLNMGQEPVTQCPHKLTPGQKRGLCTHGRSCNFDRQGVPAWLCPCNRQRPIVRPEFWRLCSLSSNTAQVRSFGRQLVDGRSDNWRPAILRRSRGSPVVYAAGRCFLGGFRVGGTEAGMLGHC